MLKLTRKKSFILVVMIIIAMVCGVLWYSIYLWGSFTSHDNVVVPEVTIKEMSIKPTVITTNDAYVRIIKHYTSGGDTPMVLEKNVYTTPNIDWNKQKLVAFIFSLWSAQSFLGIKVETIHNAKTFVLEVVDAPDGCMFTQTQVTYLAFVSQPLTADGSSITNIPVVQQTHKNPNNCKALNDEINKKND